MAMIVAFAGGDLRLMDMWGNELMNFPALKDWTEGDHVVTLQGSPTSDEQFALVCTNFGKVYLLEFEVKRKVDEEPPLESTGNPAVDKINHRRRTLGSTKYKDLIKRYEYKLVLQKVANEKA